MAEYPASFDVILGRGSLHAWHSGNRSFIKRVDENVKAYAKARSKIAKSQIIQDIYNETLGRFLMRDWNTINFKRWRKKSQKKR